MKTLFFVAENVVKKLESSLQDNKANGFLVGWEKDHSVYVSGCIALLKENDLKTSLQNLLPSGIVICGTYGDELKSKDIHFNLNEDKLNCNVSYEVLPTLKAKEEFLLKTDFWLTGRLTCNVKVKNGRLLNFIEDNSLGEYAYYLKEHNLILTSDTVDQLSPEIFDRKFASSVSVKLIKSMRAQNNNVPTIKCARQNISSYEIPVSVDILCYANQHTTAKQLFCIFDEGLKRYLNSMFSSLENFMTKNDEIGIPGAHHFMLPEWLHPVTIFYPLNLSDDDLLSYRKEVLHPRFLQPCTRPIFRKQNSINSHKHKFILTNVHVGLKDPTIIDGKNHLINGTYSYHHYMQDQINDNGWGCAYRSLQTIISWFTLQGYTSKPMPTHKEIQQILVNVGDKPKEFVGTRKWIGSIEVSNVLNEYLGVTSKIMFVSQGSELASRGRELSMHFEKHGTPVMIGGGVLAHTILGVRFSETSGETRFLILDPHYTGSEDLKTIQDKGWCGWKAPSFWNQTAYYNLCLPQTPDVF